MSTSIERFGHLTASSKQANRVNRSILAKGRTNTRLGFGATFFQCLKRSEEPPQIQYKLDWVKETASFR